MHDSELDFLLKDHFRQLLQLQSQLGNYEIIKPGRVFIKEGELFKLSRKGRQPRYFILVSVCFVIVCLFTFSTVNEMFELCRKLHILNVYKYFLLCVTSFFWGSGEGAFSFYFVICRNMQSRVFNDQCLVTLSSWEDIKKMDRFCCVIL